MCSTLTLGDEAKKGLQAPRGLIDMSTFMGTTFTYNRCLGCMVDRCKEINEKNNCWYA